MVKEGLMKKLLVLSLVFACMTGNAQIPADSVVMTVAGKQIPLDEFIFIAQKNSEVNLSDRKSVDAYVELFKNFKLKVAEAEDLGLDKTKAFKDELDGYRAQLTSSYLSDKDGEEAAVRAVYDRYGEVLELSHILFRLPQRTLSKDTVPVYRKAIEAYKRIQAGEDFAAVGEELKDADKENVGYEYVHSLLPMQTVKAFENAAYSMPVGSVSLPVRTTMGFHIIKIHSRKRNPGLVRVAHVLTDSLARAEEVYRKAKDGADFAGLAKEYSSDAGSAKRGGELPAFGVGEMVEPFEAAAFALDTPGELSRPVKTRFGYHVIKLIEKKGLPSFDDKKKGWSRQMAQGERNFEYYGAFDERMKKEYGYRFYPEAYAELQALCNDYFPSDPAFYEKAKEMDKTLFHLNGTDFPQSEFAYYIQRCPFSTKSYAGDFMQEVYDLFIRDIVTTAERKNLTAKHPEFELLMQEYRDGILLFDISNKEVWNKPMDQQAQAEAEWIEQLNRKYPVTINRKLVKKVSKMAKK
ncbi:peptidylprolyl isomerase [uncultured Parabacteroides sp.]|uniref:peptidylprolyl isomerase n=1 Tax=uncultured Parabacteroides sp. TaxID=512312 RepID=UPI002805717C|nr:peptidylprolyl isomerase [uncultured Parabacteroides sp.]MBD9168089.1 parvulin peptidyl-prolyl isomerase [Parabacteroides johnsonii]